MSTSTFWEDIVLYHTEKIANNTEQYNVPYILDTPTHISHVVDTMIDNFFHGDAPQESEEAYTSMLDGMFTLLGSLAYSNDLGYEFNVDEIVTTLTKKQLDYGPLNITRFGVNGLIVRLHDKVARLNNLISSARDAENEPLRDTFMDIIGYSVIGLMIIRNEFLTPLRAAQ